MHAHHLTWTVEVLYMYSLLETRFFLCVRKYTEIYEYRQKNIFLMVYPQKNTHRNMMTKKSIVLCVRRQKQFFYGCYTHRKIPLAQIKFKYCVH